MSDGVQITAGSGTTISTEEVTTLNGAAVAAQHVQRAALSVRTADAEAVDLPGCATYGLDVDVTRLPALPAGTNNIGAVTPYAAAASFISGVSGTITDTTPTAVIAAGGTGVVNYITSIMVTNGGSTGTFVNLTDGSGGTTLWSGYAAPGGGGYCATLPVPIKMTANTALYAACGTSGAAVRVCAAGYKA